MINSKDISVVVQGPVIGSFNESIENRYTYRCLISIRKYLPDAEIILSTWEECDVEGLDFDKVIFSKSIKAPKIYMPGTNENPKLYSINHQLITTQTGLKQASRAYVMKIRSDMILTGIGFLKYFDKYKEKSDSEWSVLSSRVVTLPAYNPKLYIKMPFDVPDWFYFGKKEDIMDIFDVPLVDFDSCKYRKGENILHVEDVIGAEQYIWTAFLHKHVKFEFENSVDLQHNSIENSEKSIAENLVMVPADRLGVLNLKSPHSSYGAKPWLSSGFYTFDEWRMLYKKYCAPKYCILPNYFEILLRNIQCFLRFHLKETRAYARIVNIIRKIRECLHKQKKWR